MADYIEREAVIDLFYQVDPENDGSDGCTVVYTAGNYSSDEIEAVISDLPAADVAPVVHGRWVTHYRSGTPVAEGYVSTCCDMWNNRKSDYCPNCGAKMDLEEQT